MLKRIKPVSMVLLASTLCFSGNIYSASSAGNPDTDISQQNAKVIRKHIDKLFHKDRETRRKDK